MSVSLDTTCGSRREWPREATIRMDIDPKAKPDIVASVYYLPFGSCTFSDIWCHPPFVIGSGQFTHWLGRFANIFHRRQWKEFVRVSEEEFLRCLKPDGRLHYNVDEGHFWGMAQYPTLKSTITRFVVESDEVIPLSQFVSTYRIAKLLNGDSRKSISFSKTPPSYPFGNFARHYITFKPIKSN